MLEIIFSEIIVLYIKKRSYKVEKNFKKKHRQVWTDEPKAFYTNQIFFSTPFSMMITNEISEVMIFCVTEIFSYQAQIDKLFLRKYWDNF